MTDCVDASVESIQPSRPHSPLHTVLVDANLRELRRSDNSVLSSRNRRRPSIGRGA